MLNNYVKTPVVPLLSQASRQQLNSKLSLFGLVSSKPESSETSSSSDSCISFRYLNSSATPAKTTGASHPSPINMSGLGQRIHLICRCPVIEGKVLFEMVPCDLSTIGSTSTKQSGLWKIGERGALQNRPFANQCMCQL